MVRNGFDPFNCDQIKTFSILIRTLPSSFRLNKLHLHANRQTPTPLTCDNIEFIHMIVRFQAKWRPANQGEEANLAERRLRGTRANIDT